MGARRWRIGGRAARPDGAGEGASESGAALDVALALQAVAQSGRLVERLRDLDGVYAVALSDAHGPDVHLDLRRRHAAPHEETAPPEVTLRVKDAACVGFWAGEPGDAVRVLCGTLELEGDARKALRLVSSLPRLRRLVAEEIGRPAAGSAASVAPLSEVVSLGHLPRVDTAAAEHRALVAALLVLARSPAERREELERLVLATTVAQVPHGAMVDVLEVLCSIARDRTAEVRVA